MPVKHLLLLLIALPLLAQANDEQNKLDEQPDLSLLEFLGSFEEQDNIWLDVEIDELQTARAKQEVQDHD